MLVTLFVKPGRLARVQETARQYLLDVLLEGESFGGCESVGQRMGLGRLKQLPYTGFSLGILSLFEGALVHN